MDNLKMPATWNTHLNIIIANILISAGDVSVTWSSPALPKLYSNDSLVNPLDQPITPAQDDILGSILNVGAIIGPWPFGIIADRIGRKKVLLLLAIPHIIAFLILGFAKNIYLYYFARLLAGLALGAGYYLVPLYVGEIVESSNRGSMVAITNIFWCIGDFLSLVIGSNASFSNFNFFLMCFPILFMVLFSVLGVESPYYLMGLNKKQAAKKSLTLLRSGNEEEITEEMETLMNFLKFHEDGEFLDILKDKFLRKNILISMFLLVCLTCSGFWAITFHLELMFENSGTNLSSDTSAIIVGAALLISSFITPILMSKIGRKPLLISSFFGMSSSLIVLGTYFHFFNSPSFKWMPLLCLALYLTSFNLGAAIIPWILLAELFPNKFKNAAASYCATLFSTVNFIVTLNFNNLISIIGMSGIFYFFGLWCLTGAVFSYFFVPETKVNLLATTGDITLSWTSPVFPKLKSNDSTINPLGKPITMQEDSILGSILNIGALIGPIPFNFLTQTFGYKKTLLCLAIPHIVSFLVLGFAKSIYLYYFARFLAGISLGAGYSLYALYVGEISDDSNRGGMVVITNIFWSMGNFIPLAIGPYLSIRIFNIILSCIPLVYFALFSVIGAESPYYLMRNKKEEEAENVLMYLRGSSNKEDVSDEMKKIKGFVKNSSGGRILDILTDEVLRKYLVICCILLATQDLGGYCSILYHLQLIFHSAGSNLSEDTAALIVGVGLFLSSFIAPFFVDKFGRKPLLIISCSGMSVSLASLGLYFYFLDSGNDVISHIKFLPLLSLISYIISYNLGINTVPWSLISELFPSKNKQTASTIGAFCCWLTTAVVTYCYNYLNDFLDIFGTFWLFSAWCLLSTIFCIIFVPETKGKSFLEVQKMIYNNNKRDDNTELNKL